MTKQDRFLFRAICNDGKFHYGYLSRLYEDRGEGKKGDFCISNNSFCPYAYLVTRPETIGQCTGLKDKNGKLIYEGDIVRLEDHGYDSESCIYHTKCVWDSYYKAGFYLICVSTGQEFYITRNDLEVIGNIHETPELLEQKNDAD